MGVQYETFMGGYTPICNNCGVSLCWDISPNDYEEDKDFWEQWTCKDCNPNYQGALKRWRVENVKRTRSGSGKTEGHTRQGPEMAKRPKDNT